MYATSTTTITVVENGQTALALADTYVINRRVECCESVIDTACMKTRPTTSQLSNLVLSQTWSKITTHDAATATSSKVPGVKPIHALPPQMQYRSRAIRTYQNDFEIDNHQSTQAVIKTSRTIVRRRWHQEDSRLPIKQFDLTNLGRLTSGLVSCMSH